MDGITTELLQGGVEGGGEELKQLLKLQAVEYAYTLIAIIQQEKEIPKDWTTSASWIIVSICK